MICQLASDLELRAAPAARVISHRGRIRCKHLATLYSLKQAGVDFLAGQVSATLTAMVFNFVVNNRLTYGDRRLTGANAVVGLGLFVMVCSVGGLANVGVAKRMQDDNLCRCHEF